MNQCDADGACDIMYSIRDCINADDIRRALELTNELYDMLIVVLALKKED